MTSIENELLNTFFERLSEGDDLDGKLIAELKKGLTAARLPKADQLVAVISDTAGESVA